MWGDMTKWFLMCVAIAAISSLCFGQNAGSAPEMREMTGMSHTGDASVPRSFIDTLELHTTSGTDAQPNSTPSEMLIGPKGGWVFMFHGEAFINDIQQSGPRGGDKFFSTNWFMPMAQRKLSSNGTLTLRTMLSLEPTTVSERQYPELLEIGETALGKPIVDGQHPHDFFMEVAAS
jgi:hypothetical protein